MEPDVRAAIGEPGDDVGRRRVACVADVRLEGDAQDADLGALERPAPVVQRLGDQVDDVARHREVDVAGQLDEPVDEVELAGAPRQVVRVDRDAVPADAGAGRELHEPERLGRRRVDDLPDIEAHPLAQQGELVHERDVDVAKDILEQLGELGGVGRGQLTTWSLIRRRSAAAAPRRLPVSSPRRVAARPCWRSRDRPG